MEQSLLGVFLDILILDILKKLLIKYISHLLSGIFMTKGQYWYQLLLLSLGNCYFPPNI